MPSAVKYHVFQEKTFQGLVYCDYCGKLLWGMDRQGVHCTECGYNCHTSCSDLVIQCRPSRRWSPDSLSVTDSEPESLSKYNPRASLDRYLDDNSSQHSNSGRKQPPRKLDTSELSRSHSSTKLLEEAVLKSPTFDKRANKSYRKSLKQQLQQQYGGSDANMSPHATAKAFTRLVARSKAFFYIGKSIHDIYSWKNKYFSILFCLFWIGSCLNSMTLLSIPPLLIILLYTQTGIINQPATQILFPRFDENTAEYYMNLENMQYAFLFFIRVYDNFAYHLQHVKLNSTTYKILLTTSFIISGLFFVFGKWLVMSIGLMVLLNRTWVGSFVEAVLQFLMELLQTFVDLLEKFKKKEKKVLLNQPIQVSVYENQRWWAGHGYTSQLLRSERSGWSNITGLEPLPPKEEMPSPTHYTWADDDQWHLDTTGPWTDDALEIVNIIECDENGWVYSDHRWLNPRSRPESITGRAAALATSHSDNSRALTRRRRWYRKANPIINEKSM